jgi:hypothetical protein
MEKARTLIVTVTAWLSFLASLWLLFLNLIPWEAVVTFGVLAVLVFGLAAAK